jgi:hypothetical protein
MRRKEHEQLMFCNQNELKLNKKICFENDKETTQALST